MVFYFHDLDRKVISILINTNSDKQNTGKQKERKTMKEQDTQHNSVKSRPFEKNNIWKQR